MRGKVMDGIVIYPNTDIIIEGRKNTEITAGRNIFSPLHRINNITVSPDIQSTVM
jgi:hypothetical protein